MITWPESPIPPPPIARRSTPRAASASARVAMAPGSFFSWTTNWLAIDPSSTTREGRFYRASTRWRRRSGGRDAGDQREDDQAKDDEERLDPLARRMGRRLVARGHDAMLGLARPVRHGTFGPVIDPIVAAALAKPSAPDDSTVEAAEIPFHVLAWGAP